jgi:hypothetical protein
LVVPSVEDPNTTALPVGTVISTSSLAAMPLALKPNDTVASNGLK